MSRFQSHQKSGIAGVRVVAHAAGAAATRAIFRARRGSLRAFGAR